MAASRSSRKKKLRRNVKKKTRLKVKRNLTLASTGVQTKLKESNGHAVALPKNTAMNVCPEKSSNLPPKSAPLAPSTKKSRGGNPLVKKKRKLSKSQKEWDFIIKKFVQRDKIIWPRDLAVLRGLMKEYSEFAFWHSLPAPFQMNAMQGFLTPKAAQFLKLQYAKFNLQLPEPERIILAPNPVCEPLVYAPRKPTSIMDFCR